VSIKKRRPAKGRRGGIKILMHHRYHDGKRKAKTQPLLVAVYDGRKLLGHVRERDGKFHALDSERRLIGKFASLHDAARACGGGP
jgi:hypothetical protein